MDTTTYYEVLEIDSTAAHIDVKKAYRRLALQHHPDRNKGSAESTEKFKRISEAYEVLSDTEKRNGYDRELQNPGLNLNSFASGHRYSTGRTRHTFTNPFSQFETLFRNDAFFSEAFKDMDDVFAQRFQQRSASDTASGDDDAEVNVSHGWVPWLLGLCGINFQMSTYSTTGDGGFTSSTYSSTSSGGSSTSKRSRTFIDACGRRVTVRSMERGGNRIEDTYVNNELTERRVNGVLEGSPPSTKDSIVS